MKKPTISSLTKKLDVIYSKYIRLKYSVNGYVKCVSCGERKHWKEMQCGHYVSRSHRATRYLEENTHPQCVKCNIFLKGNMDAYALYLIKKYGVDILKKLAKEKKKIKQFTIKELQELCDKYNNLIRKEDSSLTNL